MREAVGILIIRKLKDDVKVLLLERGSGSKVGQWSMLSGEMEPDEVKNSDLIGALRREIDEEIGDGNSSKIKIMDTTLSEQTIEESVGLTFHYFIGVCYEDLDINISIKDVHTGLQENTNYRWVDPCSVDEDIKPKLFRGLDHKLSVICGNQKN